MTLQALDIYAIIMVFQVIFLGLKMIVQVPYNLEIIISELLIFMVHSWYVLSTIL